jgi:hypothetical protein
LVFRAFVEGIDDKENRGKPFNTLDEKRKEKRLVRLHRYTLRFRSIVSNPKAIGDDPELIYDLFAKRPD